MIEIIKIRDEIFQLHPTGAMYWEKEKLLIISDVHLGKISHFRKYGSAVPQNAIGENFERLTAVVDYFEPETICFLGDLFHSSLNIEWNLFENWVSSVSAKIQLVAGNHDIISVLKYEQLQIDVVESITLNQMYFTHHPQQHPQLFNFCGHLHPGFKLRGTGRQLLKLRCFYKSENQLILPAFGEFTGNYWINPVEGDKVYALTKKEVILVY